MKRIRRINGLDAITIEYEDESGVVKTEPVKWRGINEHHFMLDEFVSSLTDKQLDALMKKLYQLRHGEMQIWAAGTKEIAARKNKGSNYEYNIQGNT